MRSIAESDLGTPKSKSTETIALTIDGVDVCVPGGTSVLRAASEAGITIPKLCATELLDAFGSYRLCLVEIEGMRGYPASCTTPAERFCAAERMTASGVRSSCETVATNSICCAASRSDRRALSTTRPTPDASTARMPKLRYRLRRRARATAASSDPAECWTTNCHAGPANPATRYSLIRAVR